MRSKGCIDIDGLGIQATCVCVCSYSPGSFPFLNLRGSHGFMAVVHDKYTVFVELYVCACVRVLVCARIAFVCMCGFCAAE